MAQQTKVSTNLQQDFTDNQQKQARKNISASNMKFLTSYSAYGPIYTTGDTILVSNTTHSLNVEFADGTAQQYAGLVPIAATGDSGKVLTVTDNVGTYGWQAIDFPRLGPNMQFLTTEIINLNTYDYDLNIVEGKAYLLNCDAGAGSINLTTNVTDHPVYTIICINADGSASCPSVTVKWKDEALGNCESSFQFQDTTSNAQYLMHVYIQKLYRESAQQYYSVARVMDYPVAYRYIPEHVDTTYDTVVQVGAAY